MNMKNNKRILLINLCISTILMFSIGFTYATTSAELQNQQKDIDAEINKLHSELADNKEQMTAALNQINNLNAEINVYENEIDELEERLVSVNAQIAEKTENLTIQEQKYDEQRKLFEQRMIAMYEAGPTTYLDMLLSSNGITDFISNYYLISQLAKADEDLLDKIESTRKQIEDEKNYLVSAMEEIKSTQEEMQNKKNSLNNSKSKKQSLVSNLSEEEKKIQAELEAHEEMKRQIQKELAEIAKKNNYTLVEPSAAGYISPLAGKTKANVSTGYRIPSYKTHTGVDFRAAGGTPIYAVKSGTVVTSKALTYPSGAYKSYGEYIVIDHHDGTMTLYAHMQPGSRMVSVNQNVNQGQQIGKVGTTGNSTGNHLHFEVRVNGKDVNPMPYLP